VREYYFTFYSSGSLMGCKGSTGKSLISLAGVSGPLVDRTSCSEDLYSLHSDRLPYYMLTTLYPLQAFLY
jgi:hypothetical protein